MTPTTEQPVREPAIRQSRLNALMLAWHKRSPQQRRILRLVTCLTMLALSVDVAVVALGRHLLRETMNSADAPAATALGTDVTNVDRINTANQSGAARPADLEVWYNRYKPGQLAWICGAVSSLLLIGSSGLGRRVPRVAGLLYLMGLLAGLALLAWAGLGLWRRLAISGSPPLGHMVDSLLWVAFLAAAAGIGLEIIYRKRVLALAGVLLATLGFLLADRLPTVFAPDIQPLPGILRSNTWLFAHVLTMVSALAALGLSWVLGILNLALVIARPRRSEWLSTLSAYCLGAMQIGVVLLAVGMILGACWAAEAWGQFWSWDPKEVWALVTLLCYLLALQARHAGWIADFGLAVCAVLCFGSVLMAWYGVNFVLRSGLHTYGFGSGNDFWLVWVGLANIALLLHASARYVLANRPPVLQPGGTV